MKEMEILNLLHLQLIFTNMENYNCSVKRLFQSEISYLETHPNASLEDYVNYLNESYLNTKKEIKDREINYTNWFKERDGKYFFINFNDTSYCVFQFNCPNNIDDSTNLIKCKRYDIFSKFGAYQISEANQYKINKLWMHNPYEKFNSTVGDIICCKEISKEQFDKIENFVNNSVKSFIDNILIELK